MPLYTIILSLKFFKKMPLEMDSNNNYEMPLSCISIIIFIFVSFFIQMSLKVNFVVTMLIKLM